MHACSSGLQYMPEMTESNIYDYQEIMLVVYVLSNDILLKPISSLVERIRWPLIDFLLYTVTALRPIRVKGLSLRASWS